MANVTKVESCGKNMCCAEGITAEERATVAEDVTASRIDKFARVVRIIDDVVFKGAPVVAMSVLPMFLMSSGHAKPEDK